MSECPPITDHRNIRTTEKIEVAESKCSVKISTKSIAASARSSTSLAKTAKMTKMTGVISDSLQVAMRDNCHRF